MMNIMIIETETKGNVGFKGGVNMFIIKHIH